MKNDNKKSSYFLFFLIPPLVMGSVGCTVTPQYIPPQIAHPEEWHATPPEGISFDSSSCTSTEIFNFFNDPILSSLLERAAEQNRDLLILKTRMQQARLLRKGKEWETLPHIDASVTGGHLYSSKELLKKGLFKENNSHGRNMNFFELGFDADWEIDLFGYHKHQVSAAEAKIEGVEASFRALWLSLSAEIARNYVELRGFQHRRALLFKRCNDLNESLHLTKELTFL